VVDKTDNKFGENLRALVRKKFRTYDEAATALNISLSYLQQIMRGERTPSFTNLMQFGQVLGENELFLDETKRSALDMAKAASQVAIEKRKKRIETLAWEFNLDDTNEEDLKTIEELLPLLPRLKDIPTAKLLNLLNDKEEKNKGPSLSGPRKELFDLIAKLPDDRLPRARDLIKGLGKPTLNKNKSGRLGSSGTK